MWKNSLHELIDKISACQCVFVRCIKPNSTATAPSPHFSEEFVVKQLRYCSFSLCLLTRAFKSATKATKASTNFRFRRGEQKAHMLPLSLKLG
jgi:hypothetical protein